MFIMASRALAVWLFAILSLLLDTSMVLGRKGKITRPYTIPEEEPEVDNPLGVKVDYAFAAQDLGGGNLGSHYWMASSFLTFAEGTTLSDGQILKLAIDAWGEIDPAFDAYNALVVTPTVMTAMAFDNKVILVTSQRGFRSYSYKAAEATEEVSIALEKCYKRARSTQPEGTPEKELKHINEAMCGEVMAAHLYYKRNKTPLNEKEARAVTVWTTDEVTKWKKPCPQDDDGKRWGCTQFGETAGINFIAEATTEEDYPEIVEIDQIRMCEALAE
ncbi:hypothetical protein NM208_g347 [Fusarium decemcellulare]|uniref:Uncharacterized protein n=1 Tax=Fusarium decemcellulare TaxID=57161 RepID=A0ACC1T045_9HYPO|nr:hypothetical protein NM208_g347 [Fusarium decemcellulare]